MGLPVGMMYDRRSRPSDRTPAPAPSRFRLVIPGRSQGLKGCPLRHEADEAGVMRQVACGDIKGTLESCRKCQRGAK